jgi:hypothetical protein
MTERRTTRPRGNKTSKLAREQRVAAVIPKLEEGQTVTQAAAEQGVHRTTLHRNLRELTLKLAATNLTEHQARVQAQEAALLFIEESLLEEKVSSEVANAWRAVRADIAKLRGLNAESRAVVAHISAQVTVGAHRVLPHLHGLTEAQLSKVCRFADSLEREPLPVPAGPPKLLEGGSL